MKKKLIPVLILLMVAAASVIVYRQWNRKPDNLIRFSGNLELTEVNIAFKIPGRISELNVIEGAPVKAGQVLARLDKDQLLRQKDREEAGVVSAQSLLAQSVTGVEWQRRTWSSDLDARKAELAAVEARLRELEGGSRPQEIEEATAAVAGARTEADRAAKDWQRAQTLYKQDDISTSQFDQFRTRHEAASSTLRQAEQRLALVREGPRQEVIAAARSQVARARAAVAFGEAQGLELQRRKQEVSTRRAEIDRAKAQAALVDSQITDAEVVSPVNGVVLVKSADAGEVIAAGTTLATVGDLDRPWLRGYVGEKDLGRVKLGQKVKITTDSYPGKVYWGAISFISSEAEFTPKQIQTPEERVKLVYRIKVDVENPKQELKSNMPADGVIVLE
ncbi:MAG: efflux RND transporter periplasmic adaptor subunit [Bryobacteraceae bacterium]